jgi:membrane protein implicated in regulation of membrane protease activity
MRPAPLSALGYALLLFAATLVALFLFFLSPPLTAAVAILLVMVGLQRRRQQWLRTAPPPQRQAGVRILHKRGWVDERNALHYQIAFGHEEWGAETLTYEVPEAVYNAHSEGEQGTLTIQAASWRQPTDEAIFVSFEPETIPS